MLGTISSRQPAVWLQGAALVGSLAALIALAPPAAILLALAGLAALALLRRPVLGLAVAALGVPFGSLAPLPLGGGALTLVPLALAGTGLVWMLASLARGRAPALQIPGGLGMALCIFLAALGAASWRAPDVIAALFESARWLELSLAMLLAAGLSRNRDIRLLLLGLLLAGAAQALLGGWMAVQRIGPEAFAALGGRIFRAHGSFGQPNPFAGYMNMVWPLGAALLVTWLSESRAAGPELGEHEHRLPRQLALLGGLAGAGCGLALILSWSRGGWLAAMAGAGAMALGWLASSLRRPAGRRRAACLAWAAATGIVLALLAGALERVPAGITERLASIGQSEQLWGVADAEVTDASFSTIERIAHWEAAVSMLEARPWLGQGPGHYALAYDAFRLPRWSEPLGHAHNVYLNFLAETGVLGLLGFLVFWAALLRLALRALWAPAGALHAALGLGLLGVLAATSTHNLLDNLFVHEMPVHLGLLAGLTLAAGRRSTAPETTRPISSAWTGGER